jgi:hypothetical protein
MKCNNAASIRETNHISARRLDDFKTEYNVSVYFSVCILPCFRRLQTTRAHHFRSDCCLLYCLQIFQLRYVLISHSWKYRLCAEPLDRVLWCIALLRLGWSTPRPGRFTPGKDPVPTAQEAGWASQPVWTGAENLATTGILSPAYRDILVQLCPLVSGDQRTQHQGFLRSCDHAS